MRARVRTAASLGAVTGLTIEKFIAGPSPPTDASAENRSASSAARASAADASAMASAMGSGAPGAAAVPRRALEYTRSALPASAAIDTGGGTHTSTLHGSTDGGVAALVGCAVESVSATSFQFSPVACMMSAS